MVWLGLICDIIIIIIFSSVYVLFVSCCCLWLLFHWQSCERSRLLELRNWFHLQRSIPVFIWEWNSVFTSLNFCCRWRPWCGRFVGGCIFEVFYGVRQVWRWSCLERGSAYAINCACVIWEDSFLVTWWFFQCWSWRSWGHRFLT